MKQQSLKVHRDYLKNPRCSTERDLDYRDDYVENLPSLTKQADAEAADINNIVERYLKTGIAPGMSRDPIYGDFSTAETFQEAMNIVAEANAQFAGLSADIREEFQNDPSRFLQFVEDAQKDGEKGKKLVDWGLAEPQKETAEQILRDVRTNTAKAPKTAEDENSGASKDK